jgi:Ca2+-binding EF-hand superfamily protein
MRRFAFSLLYALAAQSPAGIAAQQVIDPRAMMQASPALKAIDANGDKAITAAELADAPAKLRTLDRNSDGTLARNEVAVPTAALQAMLGRPGGAGPGREGRGEGGREGRGREGRGEREEEQIPAPGPTADELFASLISFDKNKDGKLEKAEVPGRMQGMFERADTDKNDVLDNTELKKLSADQAAAPVAPPMRRGFSPLDPAAAALDTNKDGELTGDEIDKAAASLKLLDKNGDGTITEDEVRPALPGRGGTR